MPSFSQVMDWRNRGNVTAAVLITDQASECAESVPLHYASAEVKLSSRYIKSIVIYVDQWADFMPWNHGIKRKQRERHWRLCRIWHTCQLFRTPRSRCLSSYVIRLWVVILLGRPIQGRPVFERTEFHNLLNQARTARHRLSPWLVHYLFSITPWG